MFSIFDPQVFIGLSLNWISALFFIFILRGSYWRGISKRGLVLGGVLRSLLKEFKAILGGKYQPGILLIRLSLFIFIFLNNFIGLFPYVFTASRHLTFTISLALPLWRGFYFYSWVKTPSKRFAHLVPQGSPIGLSPFIVVVELLSSLIRPITLSVRLTANIVAGHLLLVLLSRPMISVSFAGVVCIMIFLVILSVLECAVAIIQAYVFSTLSVLYYEEVSSLRFA